jgi:hypothetical protein
MFPKKAPVQNPKMCTTCPSTLKTSKLQPFAAHYVTKLTSANNKLVCSLSSAAAALSDVCKDGG